jgi:pentatricopeptide repeat protein
VLLLRPHAAHPNASMAAITMRKTMLSMWKNISLAHPIPPQHSFHTCNATADMRIKTLCETNRLTEAVDTFKHLLSDKSESTPSLITCNLLLSSLVRRHRHESALSVYRLIVEADIVPDLITLNIVINCHCQTGRMDYAFQVFEGMEAHGYVPDVITFCTLIKGFCRLGKIEDAVKLFKQMVGKRQVPNLITYNTLIDGLCKTGKTHEAFGLLAVMLQKGHEP